MNLPQHKRDLALFIYDSLPLTQVDDTKERFKPKDIEGIIDAYIDAILEESQEDKQLRFDSNEEQREFDKEAGNIQD